MEEITVTKCGICGQLGIDGLKLHRERKHGDILARRRAERAARKGKFLDRLGLEACDPKTESTTPDVQTSCSSTLEASNPLIKVENSEDSAILNLNSQVNLSDTTHSVSSVIRVKAEPIHGNDDVLVLEEGAPRSKRRRRRSSSVSSNATLPIRYIINTEKIDPGYDKYEILDDRDHDIKLFEAEENEMKVEEKLAKYLDDPYLEIQQTQNPVVGGEYFVVHAQVITPEPPLSLVKAEGVKHEKPKIIPKPRFLSKCPVKKCNYWICSSHQRKHVKRLQKLIAHFKTHIEEAEQQTLRWQAKNFADNIQRKLDADTFC